MDAICPLCRHPSEVGHACSTVPPVSLEPERAPILNAVLSALGRGLKNHVEVGEIVPGLLYNGGPVSRDALAGLYNLQSEKRLPHALTLEGKPALVVRGIDGYTVVAVPETAPATSYVVEHQPDGTPLWGFQGPPAAPQGIPRESMGLFHQAWGKAKDSPNYDKGAWMRAHTELVYSGRNRGGTVDEESGGYTHSLASVDGEALTHCGRRYFFVATSSNPTCPICSRGEAPLGLGDLKQDESTAAKWFFGPDGVPPGGDRVSRVLAKVADALEREAGCGLPEPAVLRASALLLRAMVGVGEHDREEAIRADERHQVLAAMRAGLVIDGGTHLPALLWAHDLDEQLRIEQGYGYPQPKFEEVEALARLRAKALTGSLVAQALEPELEVTPPRPLHLAWLGGEWVDVRCGCRYHPDDQRGTHGGAPHVHRCSRHGGVEILLSCPTCQCDVPRDQWSEEAGRCVPCVDVGKSNVPSGLGNG